jgi:hypothetical protein
LRDVQCVVPARVVVNESIYERLECARLEDRMRRDIEQRISVLHSQLHTDHRTVAGLSRDQPVHRLQGAGEDGSPSGWRESLPKETEPTLHTEEDGTLALRRDTLAASPVDAGSPCALDWKSDTLSWYREF